MSPDADRARAVVLVGLGTISSVHVRALEQFAGVDVIAGVDLEPDRVLRFRGARRPVYADLATAVERHRFDAVIVSTPTPVHAGVCATALALEISADVLVEKPLAIRLEDVHGLVEQARNAGRSLRVLYHAAHGAEVLWAVGFLRELTSAVGPVRRIESWHMDPYGALAPVRSDVFVSSWVDAGINALSILDRLVELRQVTALREFTDAPSTFEAAVTFDSEGAEGHGTIFTSWDVSEPSKGTRLIFDEHIELVLDHVAVSGRLLREGRVDAIFGTDGRIPRLVGHYTALFEHELDGTDMRNTADHDVRLHRLLLSRKPEPFRASSPARPGPPPSRTASTAPAQPVPPQASDRNTR
jgi:predicted dehydrogenase